MPSSRGSSQPRDWTSVSYVSCISRWVLYHLGFPDSSVGKESICNAGDLGSIPGLGRSPREGNGYPLQYSGLENSMDCIVHGLAKSRTLSDFHYHCITCSLTFSLPLVPPGKPQQQPWIYILSLLSLPLPAHPSPLGHQLVNLLCLNPGGRELTLEIFSSNSKQLCDQRTKFMFLKLFSLTD